MNSNKMQPMKTQGLLVMVLLAVTLVACAKKDKATSTHGGEANSPRPTVGTSTAKVDVLAFIDYQCPFCSSNAKELLAVADKHKDVMRLRVVNLPLDVHANSVVLAKGTVAAQKHGKWRAYYLKILGMESANRDSVIGWAVDAGLDAKAFKADLDGREMADVVAADVAMAGALGVTGTPSYIVNGGLLQGAIDGAAWDKLIASQSAKYDELAKQGGERDEVMAKVVTANAKDRAASYAKYVVAGKRAPARPVPAKVERKSGVASAEIAPAGGGMGGIKIGEPVRVGDTSGDSSIVWRVGVRPDDPVRGPEHAPVTIVVFEDMQCPYCQKLQSTLEQVRKKYGDKLRIVFKHNPLPFHDNAMDAAIAIEAARAQGKFWQMHDAVLQGQDKLLAADLVDKAKAIGLDMAQYDNSITSAGAKPRIQQDIEQAAALGARGTPNLYIHGRKLVGAKKIETLTKLVDEELQKAQKLISAGTPLSEVYRKMVGEGRLLDSLSSTSSSIDVTEGTTRGPPGARIHIVTFQDLQCPFCARLDQHIRVVEKEFPGLIKVTFMHFPLQIHPQARMAAQAAHEAGKQGKFWEFVEAAMANQSKLDKDGLLATARSLKLNARAMRKVLGGKNPKKDHSLAVQRSYSEGVKHGVKGTPTVFINGHSFTPQLGFSANTFRSAIVRLLQAQ